MPQTKQKRKGLGGGGVCLLQHYCPFCFKGKIGMSCGLSVSKGSPLIDEVQAMHAAKGNGLRMLDLKSPGEFCENQAQCRLTCLVCGQGMVEGTDPEFELFLELFCEESHSVTLRYEINDAMTKHGLEWTEAWDTPVHAHCSKKTVCKCVVPLGTKVCPVHKRRLEPLPSKEGASCSMPPPVRKPALAPLVIPAVPKLGDLTTPRAPTAATERATWLPLASAKTRAKETLDIEPDSLGTKPGGGSKPPLKRPAPPSKPVANSKRAMLEASAGECKFKINTWSNAATTWEGRAPQEGGLAKKAGDGWSLALHNRTFDPEFHGYREVNGVYGYRRAPDGKFIPTQATVNTLNPDGTLTPLVDLDHQQGDTPQLVDGEGTTTTTKRARAPAVVARQVSKAKRAWMEAAGRTSQFMIEQAFTAEKK